MNIPANLKYTKDHEWVSIDGDIATVGITHFAQSELGDIVYVEVETLDQTLDKDEVGVIFAAGIGGIGTFEQEVGYYFQNKEQGPKFNPFFI